MTSKILLRQQVRAELAKLAADQRRLDSTKLCDLLQQQDVWQRAASVLLFVPLQSEPDIAPLLEASWAAGKTAALPRFDPAAREYCAGVVCRRDDLEPGSFGIVEPHPGCPVLPLNQLDFILVPGLAFDLTGRRLGRGKGFYDRLLAQVRGHKCGVCFDAQVVSAVPEELHDVRLNSILTPTRWHSCPRSA